MALHHPRWLYAFVGLLTVLTILVLADVAQAAEPVPRLTFTKTADHSAVHLGDTVTFTLKVTNSGGADSDSQTIEDFLPAGFNWVLGPRTINCEIDEGTLFCDRFIVPASEIDPNNDKIDGVQSVTLIAVARTCGTHTNDAYLVNQKTGELTIRSAVVAVVCETPTPVPTATPIPPTATPVIVVITATPSPTLNDPVPTKTPTVIRVVPLPPNTGNGQAQTADDRVNLYLLLVFGFSLFAVAGLVATRLAVASRRR